ncbi:NAD+ synthetase [Aquirufa nivalisilvae]|uniref:nitrilase-related carbon-nitrogen hydrolase n=1 Tax=Aquirufa nivalisilvae TaxID=2516557 RepID=UPI0022A8EBAA|nr:nitrilase-related carbon-nitrogen hydrolase [Aquirufa nivalisilvae]MCZ2482103.1 NAD+ synthetase [Aquirufa nivalisilvae]
MPKIALAAGVLNQIPLDWKGNQARIIDLIQHAQQQQANILCLPELCLTGYGCEDQFLSAYTSEKAWESLVQLLPHTQRILVWVGLPVFFEGKLYNVAACLAHGKLIALIPKQHLANDGVHYETRWFSPWPAGKITHISTNLGDIPMGDYRIHAHGITMGIEICQDAWEGENRPAHALAKRGVSVICSPTASHFAFSKSKTRQGLSIEGSKIIQGAYVFVNLLGNESGRTIFDGDAYIVHKGQIIAESSRFSFQDGQLIIASLDLKERNDAGKDVIIANIPSFDSVREFPAFEAAAWEKSSYLKEEEFARAVSLALWDYLRKSKSFGWVISLSGGADSSAISALCFLAVRLASQELSWTGIQEKLAYVPWMKEVQSEKELVFRILTTAYQGTENSSDNTRASAKALAECIGTTHYDWNIDVLVKEYRGIIEQAIGRSLSWEQDDITLQNVQARLRSPSVWMLANINNALLLATSNRSEASVGYATMDGDTSGSISPIAGIDKTFIRQWLIWMEKVGLDGTLTLSGLSHVNSLEPSAELRPLTSKQIDEEDLMPYPILNSIERWAFYDKLSPEICLKNLIQEYGTHFSEEQLRGFCSRFFRLWARNQWKRERYAPGFHVDDYSLDPKSWLRFPILSAGLEKDIKP